MRYTENVNSKKNRKILVSEWYRKYKYLHNLIQELEQKEEAGSSITSFMLNSQLIEYRLKKEINLLNSFINSHMPDPIFKLTTKTVEEIEEEKMTLGILIKELDRYEGDLLSKLKTTLKELKRYRNIFIHKLFNIGSLGEIEKAAVKGNQLANDAWNQMEDLNYLTGGDYENDKFG